MLGMNDEQKNLMIRQIVDRVVGPSLIGLGVTAQQLPLWVNVISVLVGAALTLGGMVYSQYKSRNAGLAAAAATIPKAAIDADPGLATTLATTAAKKEGTIIVSPPEVARASPATNVVSSATTQVVPQ